ncbi:hypothetical protein QQZ08_004510 [Neonectria magnoliae]|uniref:Uncharacterized protein n=1 Tax=Neonectria magnoliae TaxID=2732573 RepID=A0ABR1I7S6_9HYPO
MANETAAANDRQGNKAAAETAACRQPPESASSTPAHAEQQDQSRNVHPLSLPLPTLELPLAEQAAQNESRAVEQIHSGAPATATPMPSRVEQEGQSQIQADDPANTEAAHAEGQHKKAAPSRSKRTKPVQQTLAKTATSVSNNPLLDTKKYTEELISLCLDHWRARATVVSQGDQADWTNLTCGDGRRREGFFVFDGFDRTWYIPMDGSSPLPPSKQEVAEKLRKRRNALEEISTNRTYATFMLHVRRALELEAKTMCENEWDGNKLKPREPPMNWVEAKPKFDNISSLAKMIAKTRLIDGRALLPEYYHVNMIELVPNGKIMIRRVSMPFGLGFIGFRLRLNTWSPANDEQSQATLKQIRKTLDIVVKNGTEESKKKAREFLGELSKRRCDPGNDGQVWRSKHHVREHHVRESYMLQSGKGPGKISGWKPVTAENSLKVLEEGVRAGKYVTVVRTWMIHIRYMWLQVRELKNHLEPVTFGEPELNDEQLAIVDGLLASESDRARVQGERRARVLSWLNDPFCRLKLAADIADFADLNGLGNNGLDEGTGDVDE